MQPPDVICGEDVDGMMYQNGTITSPGFPENYPAFLNCRYVIRAMPGTKNGGEERRTFILIYPSRIK